VSLHACECVTHQVRNETIARILRLLSELVSIGTVLMSVCVVVDWVG